MRRPPPRLTLLLALAAPMLSSCSCDDGASTPLDAGATDTDTDTDVDVDADTDSDADAGSDSGPQPVDPEIEWIEIPAGSFIFGSPPGTPCQASMMETEVPVTLTRPFLMAKYELTQKQWTALGFPLPHRAVDCDDCPITFVNTHEAMAWCNALSAFEGLEECYDLSSCTGDIGAGCPDGDFYELGCSYQQGVEPLTLIDGLYLCSEPVRRYTSMFDCTGYRLPTGPEWEYAAKAGTTANTYNGDITESHDGDCADEPILNDIAWYCENTGAGGSDWHPDQIREVALKQPNPWGLYDMLGNAGEWADYVGTGFSLQSNEGVTGEILTDPMGALETADGRGDVRGGSMHSQPCIVRAAWQAAHPRISRVSAYGFRPVRTLPATAPEGNRGNRNRGRCFLL